MSKLTNEHAHHIAALAIRVDAADRELWQLEKTGAYHAARPIRQQVDQLRAELADAIAAATRRGA